MDVHIITIVTRVTVEEADIIMAPEINLITVAVDTIIMDGEDATITVRGKQKTATKNFLISQYMY
jgi:hypothetical protein